MRSGVVAAGMAAKVAAGDAAGVTVKAGIRWKVGGAMAVRAA